MPAIEIALEPLGDALVAATAGGGASMLPARGLGTFSDALLAEAQQEGWVVVRMKSDWKRVFPFGK